MQKKNRLLLIPLCLSVVFNAGISSSEEITVEKVIAHINDKAITLSTLNNFHKTIEKYESSFVDKKKALDILIDRELLLQLAGEYNIKANEKEINEEVKKIKEKNQDTAKDMEKYLNYQVALKQNKENLIRYIVKNNFISKPNEEKIKEIYEENKEQFYEKEKVSVAHILVKLSKDDSYEELENKESLIKNVLSLIENKKEKFKSLAKKYSDDLNTKYKGGLIGWHDLDSLTEIQPDIAFAAFELKLGQTSDIIISASGYHIIKLLDKRKARKISFYEAKQFILNKVIIEKANKYLVKMIDNKRKQSYIEKYL